MILGLAGLGLILPLTRVNIWFVQMVRPFFTNTDSSPIFEYFLMYIRKVVRGFGGN